MILRCRWPMGYDGSERVNLSLLMQGVVSFTILHIIVSFEDAANIDCRDLAPQISSGLEVWGEQGQQKLDFFLIRLTLGQKACIVLILAHNINVLLRHVALWPHLHLSSLTLYLWGDKGSLKGTPAPHSCPMCRDHRIILSYDLT